ncbi:MAG: hypothetical protein QX199_02325 [Methylococcaceae bacterium]
MNDFVNNPTTKAPPFIIWTLQRTGGTNLTQRLVDRSGLMCIQHEPFNLGRLHGQITQQWIESKDESALAKDIQEIVAQQVIIKHCVEIVPWEISRALADATVHSDYRHLFLYRKNALDRLLSLHFAQKTGVWGPNMKKEIVPEEAKELTIPVDKLINHELKCVKLMQQTWQHLISHGAHPLALSYEELYRADLKQATQALLPILKSLGLSKSEKQDYDFAQEVIGKGDQGTRDKYASMTGVAELEQALSQVPCFDPSRDTVALRIENLDLPEWVLTAQIDALPDTFSSGQLFDLGGVVVLDENAPKELSLQLTNQQTEININWGKPSQKMAKLYPDNVQSAHARFKSDEMHIAKDEVFTLAVKSPSGNYPLFNIFLA